MLLPRSSTTSCHRHLRHVRILSSILLLSLVTLLPCPVLSQSVVSIKPSPAYFTDQPLIALVLDNASTANFTATFTYTNVMPLLLTNATNIQVSVPTIFNSNSQPLALPAINAAGLRGFLLTSLTSTCKRSDSTQSGQCTIAVTLTTQPGQQFVHYSLYTLNLLQYSTTYSDTVPQHSWKYYVRYIQPVDLTVGFDLSPASNGQLTTAMFISAAQQLYTPGYPYIGNGTVVINTAADQSCLLPASEPDVPDYYIVGLYGFAATPAVSRLQVVSNINNYYSSSGFNGYAILSLLSLILAAGFIGLVLMRGCCMYRRWNGVWSRNTGSADYTIDSTRTVNVLDPSLFQTTAGQAGVLRTDRAGMVGATEAEIASLPTKLYVSSSDADGEEEGDDPRCTICLDEYESTVSHITTLHCGHSFHSACVAAWLRQRRHCPLCLQLIDQAQDVKQRRNSTVAEVELATTRPTAVVASVHTSAVASRTVLDDGTSVLGMERYSSAAQEEDADMCAIEIATPRNIGRPPL